MPTIDSLHEKIIKDTGDGPGDKGSQDISQLTSDITFSILKDAPQLVAEVEKGSVGREVLEKAIIKDIDKHRYHLGISRDQVIQQVLDYMFGYGMLQPYINDEDISDIDGSKFNEFAIKKQGRRESINVNFGSEKTFETYCKLVAVRNGGILNENDAHCRVSDEKNRLRINVAIPPRNISGSSICIRKHRKKSYTMDDLIGLGMLNEEVAKYFYKLAASRQSVLFCGKGGAGKTTLLRTFINNLPSMERVLITESDPELYPDKPHCIEQRIKKANEGGRAVTLRDLVKDGLTMSLDTYCVGEIVGPEAWEMINAGFTGHRVLASLHTVDTKEALPRLLTLSKTGGITESEKTIKEIMARSINVIVYLENFKVIDIVEVLEYIPLSDNFKFNKLFEQKNGELRPVNIPKLLEGRGKNE